MGGKEKISNPSLVRNVASGNLPDAWACLPVKGGQMDSTSSSGVEYPQGPFPSEDAGQSQQPCRGFANKSMCSTMPSRRAKDATLVLLRSFLSIYLPPHQSFLVLLLQRLAHSNSEQTLYILDMKAVGQLYSGKPVTKTPLSSTNTVTCQTSKLEEHWK